MAIEITTKTTPKSGERAVYLNGALVGFFEQVWSKWGRPQDKSTRGWNGRLKVDGEVLHVHGADSVAAAKVMAERAVAKFYRSRPPVEA